MDTLEEFAELLPNSELVVAKELTKIHERFVYGTSKEVYEFFKENSDIIKGEFIILCHPEKKEEIETTDIVDFIKKKKKEGLSNKDIAKLVSKEYSIPKNKAYKLVLEID